MTGNVESPRQPQNARHLVDSVSHQLNLQEQEERRGDFTTFDFLRLMTISDPRILGFEFHPYLNVWLPLNAPEGVQRRQTAILGPTFQLGRDSLVDSTIDMEAVCEKIRKATEKPYWEIGVLSPVRYRGETGREETRYLGLMDMSLPPTPDNLHLLQTRLTEVVVPRHGGGIVINSGNSFHYISTHIFRSKDELDKFYGSCLLLTLPKYASPTGQTMHMADTRYIGHVLSSQDSVATLRVTSSVQKPKIPNVVGVVGP